MNVNIKDSVDNKNILLSESKPNCEYRIVKIESGWRAAKRLRSMGFIANEPLKVIKNSSFGPLMLEIKGTRLAIGRGEAQKIVVQKK